MCLPTNEDPIPLVVSTVKKTARSIEKSGPSGLWTALGGRFHTPFTGITKGAARSCKGAEAPVLWALPQGGWRAFLSAGAQCSFAVKVVCLCLVTFEGWRFCLPHMGLLHPETLHSCIKEFFTLRSWVNWVIVPT